MKLTALTCLLILLAWADGPRPIERAPQRFAAQRNLMQGQESARRAGAKLYARECGACHGLERQGGEKAPALKRAEVYQAPPGALFWVLQNGSLVRGMPDFSHLPQPQRWQIITYLQSENQSEHGVR
jgi:mono/diheme cytochrome c family protein